ncbi:hypothetical protein BJX64DRAFT_48374 [Aspergillus heterothallicus]
MLLSLSTSGVILFQPSSSSIHQVGGAGQRRRGSVTILGRSWERSFRAFSFLPKSLFVYLTDWCCCGRNEGPAKDPHTNRSSRSKPSRTNKHMITSFISLQSDFID